MKSRKIIFFLIMVIFVIGLLIFINVSIESETNQTQIRNYVKSDLNNRIGTETNIYNLSQSSDKIKVHLNFICASTNSIFVKIEVQGIPNNDVKEHLKECTIIDEESNYIEYSHQKKTFATFGTYHTDKPTRNIGDMKENELVLEFINGIKKDSIISIMFDFGDFGTVTFENIYVKLAQYSTYKLCDEVPLEFDLPYAHCKLLEIEYSPLGVFLTIQWELENGFTESTKIDYPQYHVKFTFGDRSKFTFLILPNEWSSEDTKIVSKYYLEEGVKDKETIIIDLYLNDDVSFVQNLAFISLGE